MKIIKAWGHSVIFAWSLLMAGQVLASPDTSSDPDAGHLELFDGKCHLAIKETIYNMRDGHVDKNCKEFSIDTPFRFVGVRSAVSIRITTHSNLDAPWAINLRTIKDKVSTETMTYRELMGAAVGKPYFPGIRYDGVGNTPYSIWIWKIRIVLDK
jgi:hypothetical protein